MGRRRTKKFAQISSQFDHTKTPQNARRRGRLPLNAAAPDDGESKATCQNGTSNGPTSPSGKAASTSKGGSDGALPSRGRGVTGFAGFGVVAAAVPPSDTTFSGRARLK